MVESFFRKRNKDEIERGFGLGGCCIVTRCVDRDYFGDKVGFENVKLVLRGCLTYGD